MGLLPSNMLRFTFERLRLWAAIPVLHLASVGDAATATPRNPYVAPFPGVATFAQSQKIPLTGIEFRAADSTSRDGDRIVALVTLSEGGRQRQWLVQLTSVPFTEEEKRQIERAKAKLALDMFTSAGTEVTLHSAPSAMEARTAGPFHDVPAGAVTKPAKVSEKRARTLVVGGFLGLGLDRFSRAARKLRQAVAAAAPPPAEKLEWKVAMQPFAPEVVARNRPLAEALDFTPDDERALFAGPLAIRAFFDVAQKTPGLQEILGELLDKSSLAWSLLTHGGKLVPDFKPDFEALGTPVNSSAWGSDLPALYRCPLLISLNEKPILRAELIATAPQPPLRNCAGIVGISVESASDETKFLTIRVLAADSGLAVGR